MYDGNYHIATGTATGVGGANLSSELQLCGTKHKAVGTYTADTWQFTDTSGNYYNASGTITDIIFANQSMLDQVCRFSATQDAGLASSDSTTSQDDFFASLGI